MQGLPQKILRRKVRETVMKKGIAMIAVMAMLVCGIGMNVSAATQDVCNHDGEGDIITITYSTIQTSTNTHQVLVAYKPNGDPIFTTCTITTKYQPKRLICRHCATIFHDWWDEISVSHSVKH